jgi:phenylalanyl-tRNA synthetase beta chain
MKVSYNWLKEYLPLSIDAHQLADRLSLVGLEVEEVIERRFDFPGVVVGRIISVEDHPDADKLRVCQVTVGEEELSIVCGAPNAASGQVVAVARTGASLPNGLKIHKAKIRGVESNGMICSEAELGLQEESEGIWVLPENLPLGVPLDKAFQLETDFILDIAVTPNRPDCLSHLGIAREIGAMVRQPVTRPDIRLKESKKLAGEQVSIEISTEEGCPRYSARIIGNVEIGPSPSWMVKRLEAVGIRSINNVVDITNYVLMETGHPLHAFDMDLLSGQKIVVREAKNGETFTTLDDKERVLPRGTVLICDADKPVAIGGIMGGLNSEVHSNTCNILLESAYFRPESIQLSSRLLGLTTEASLRFERGADPNGTLYALDRAADLISRLCGGEIYREVVDAYPSVIQKTTVPLQTERINTLLGTSLTNGEMRELLESIDLKVKDNIVTVPTFRPDIHVLADLAEEIARLYGLDKIPPRQIFQTDYRVQINEFDIFVDELKEILAGLGLQEVISRSMVNSEIWETATGQTLFPIFNPISKDLDGLRISLLPSLAQLIQYNLNRQWKDLRLFEINRIFIPAAGQDEQPTEELHLSIALTGRKDGESWYATKKPVDFFDIKGLTEAICHKISLDNWRFISYSENGLQENGLAVYVDKKRIGSCGRLSQKVTQVFDIEENIYVADFAVKALFNNRITDKKYQPIPRFPAVERDIALIIDAGLEAEKLLSTIRKEGGSLLTYIGIFDVYQGKQIPEGKKSLAFHLTFQSAKRTLTEDEVNVLMEKIYKQTQHLYQAKLRA